MDGAGGMRKTRAFLVLATSMSRDLCGNVIFTPERYCALRFSRPDQLPLASLAVTSNANLSLIIGRLDLKPSASKGNEFPCIACKQQTHRPRFLQRSPFHTCSNSSPHFVILVTFTGLRRVSLNPMTWRSRRRRASSTGVSLVFACLRSVKSLSDIQAVSHMSSFSRCTTFALLLHFSRLTAPLHFCLLLALGLGDHFVSLIPGL